MQDSMPSFDDLASAPDATLITGAVGCGKTEAAIDAILDTRLFRPFSTIWVVLATGQQIHSFRDRLLTRSDDAVQFGVEFFDFDRLYARLLDLAGDPQRHVDDTARFQILRAVIADLAARGALELYGPIAHTPGFIGLVAGLLHELKQGLADPEQVRDVAAGRGPKDRDLALIYAGYQAFLQARRLVDRHGAGWLALEYLEADPPLRPAVDLLVVDGFDQFNQVHVRVLTALARQVKQAVLTLTDVQPEPGRRFRRFEQTRARLLAVPDHPWRVATLEGACERVDPALDRLVTDLFAATARPVEGSAAVALIEAPDIGREVGAVLRRVKRLLLAGAPPESCAVLARRLDRYAGPLRETARAYGIPLVVREGIRLADSPVVAALLALVDLARLDFPRRELVDALRSPYFDPPDLTPDQIALLERISMDRQVVRGRAAWLDAIRAAVAPVFNEDGDSVVEGRDPAAMAALHDALGRFFARITPPEAGSIPDVVAWLADLVGPDPAAADEDVAAGAEPDGVDEPPVVVAAGGLNVLGCIRAGGDPDRVVRDVMAMKTLWRVLGQLRAAADLLAGQGDPAAVAWPVFRAELELAIERTTVVPPGGLSRYGRVLVTDVLEARGLPHEHVFVLGLAEGEFPAPESEDALYQDSERLQLEAAGIAMQTVAERSDDMSLFYQAVGLARESLTLSRYTVDDKGAPVPPSPYWSAVQAVLAVPPEAVERVPVGATPTLSEVATLDEAAVALAAALSGEHADDTGLALAVHNALLARDEWAHVWRGVLRGRAIEARREDAARPFDRFAGVLADPALVAVAADLLGPGRVWSASQFTEYGVCPFRFFAKRLLRLEPWQDPVEGLDVLQRGLVNHAILEETYRRAAGHGLAMAPDHREAALDILERVAAAVFDEAPERFGFRPSPMWPQECADMLRRLRWLVEHDFSDDRSPFRPLGRNEKRPVAAAVGGGERVPFWQEAAYGFHDQPPVTIDGPAGPVHARGKIDRMDRIGDQVVVIDYKSGSTKHPASDMAAGRDFQMMLYLLAADDLLRRAGEPYTVAGGLFWHLTNRAVSGEVLAEDLAVEEARHHLHANVLAARGGYFAVQPRKLEGGRCVSYCEFGALCRMTRANTRKPGSAAGLTP